MVRFLSHALFLKLFQSLFQPLADPVDAGPADIFFNGDLGHRVDHDLIDRVSNTSLGIRVHPGHMVDLVSPQLDADSRVITDGINIDNTSPNGCLAGRFYLLDPLIAHVGKALKKVIFVQLGILADSQDRLLPYLTGSQALEQTIHR